MTVRVKRPNGRPIRIWVPVLPVVLVFSPVVVLAVLVAAVACLVYRVSAVRALGTGWRIVSANERVPLQLLRAGVRLAALIPPQALAQANAELNKSGVPFDLTQLKPEQLEALVEHLDEMIVVA